MDLLDWNDTYDLDIIRTKLTRNIAATFEEVFDELVRSLDASMPMNGDGA